MNKVYAGATPREKERLVNDYLPLVHKIARGLARRSTDPVDDLIQVGSIGLLEAINRYETGHNTEFKTYAVHFITGHIRHYLRDRQNLLRGPRVLQELSYRLSQVANRLTQSLGRDPSNHELAHALDVLGALARGETPEESPGVHCGWCPDAAVCPSVDPSAQRRTSEQR